MNFSAPRVLTVSTTELDRAIDPLLFADPANPLHWSRDGRRLVGIGQVLRLAFHGPHRFADASAAWAEIAADARVDDAVELPGTGLLAFGTFAFADGSSRSSVLIVPELVYGESDGRFWLTRIRLTAPEAGATEAEPVERPLGAEPDLTFRTGTFTPEGYRDAVVAATERIADGALEKTVLARDLVAERPADLDVRRVLERLRRDYESCWVYAVDGLIGASPETLVQVAHGRLSARVLAGTAGRHGQSEADTAGANALFASDKNREEHRFAVESVLDALEGHADELETQSEPFLLELPNLWHLATDVAGRISDRASSLDLLGALHPTAAVGGTPQAEAVALLDELEPFDRGRFAGPVGWVDGSGDGEWAIALRVAQLDDGQATAYAGCGIVRDSDPSAELAETGIKFRPIVEALGGNVPPID